MHAENQSTRNARAVRNGEITQEQARKLLRAAQAVVATSDNPKRVIAIWQLNAAIHEITTGE